MTTTKSKVVYSPVFTDGAEFRIPTFKLLKQDGKLYKSAKAPDLDKDKALRIYRAMVTTRILDERMLAAQRQGRLSFTCSAPARKPRLLAVPPHWMTPT